MSKSALKFHPTCSDHRHVTALPLTADVLPLGTMPQFLLAPRNVFVYDGTTNPAKVVAGFHQFGRTSQTTVYRALDICFYRPEARQYRLLAEDATFVERDTNILPLGNYYVVSICEFRVLGALTFSRPCTIRTRCVDSGAGSLAHAVSCRDHLGPSMFPA